MNIKYLAYPTALLALVAFASGAYAQDTPTPSPTGMHQNGAGNFGRPNEFMNKGARPIIGNVTAIDGSTLTLAGANGTTYTIDASNATFMKRSTPPTDGSKPAAPESATLSDITTGTSIMVQGPLNGTSITAKNIFIGQFDRLMNHTDQAGIAGKVTAIDGSTITVNGRDNTAYTVDASNATIKNQGSDATLSDITTNDAIMVRGTVSGTTVTATAITIAPAGTTLQNGPKPQSFTARIKNFFRGIFAHHKANTATTPATSTQ